MYVFHEDPFLHEVVQTDISFRGKVTHTPYIYFKKSLEEYDIN